MNEGIKKVFETLNNDKVLAKKMSECTSPQEAYELAGTVADGFTLEEFKDEMKKVYEAVSSVRRGELSEADLGQIHDTGSELSELDLENISGGVLGEAQEGGFASAGGF